MRMICDRAVQILALAGGTQCVGRKKSLPQEAFDDGARLGADAQKRRDSAALCMMVVAISSIDLWVVLM